MWWVYKIHVQYLGINPLNPLNLREWFLNDLSGVYRMCSAVKPVFLLITLIINDYKPNMWVWASQWSSNNQAEPWLPLLKSSFKSDFHWAHACGILIVNGCEKVCAIFVHNLFNLFLLWSRFSNLISNYYYYYTHKGSL